MTIRELITCMASDTCQKFSIRAKNGWIRLYADLDNLNDPDFILLDADADLRIKEWYINPSADIVIYTDDYLTEDQLQLCHHYGVTVIFEEGLK